MCYFSSGPDGLPVERALTSEELKALQSNLSQMNEAGVRELYSYTHCQCGLIGPHVHDAVSIRHSFRHGFAGGGIVARGCYSLPVRYLQFLVSQCKIPLK